MVSGWWLGTFVIFHNLWDVILPIDFHIIPDGWNHQPGVVDHCFHQKLAPDGSQADSDPIPPPAPPMPPLPPPPPARATTWKKGSAAVLETESNGEQSMDGKKSHYVILCGCVGNIGISLSILNCCFLRYVNGENYDKPWDNEPW